MTKSRVGLVKKVIVDKNGKKNTVWVKPEGVEVKRAKSHGLTSSYDYILKKVNKDMSPNSPDYKEALALKVIMMHGLRVGNENSAVGFKRHGSGEVESSFGLLTLQPRHVIIKPDKAILIFKGKKGITQKIEIKNKSLIDGLEYFKDKTEKNGAVLGMTNYELRKYINKTVGGNYSPKDFRMMRANIEAKRKSEEILKRNEKPKTKTELQTEINEILDHVASVLGNTNKVAKRSYIDDNVLMEFMHKRMKGVKR